MSHRCPQSPFPIQGTPSAPRLAAVLPSPAVGLWHSCWTRSAVAVRPVLTHSVGTVGAGCGKSWDVTGTSPAWGLPLCQGWTGRTNTVGMRRGWSLGCRQ